MREAIKTEFQGKICRAVGNRLFTNRDLRETDHEFLISCLGSFFRESWYQNELKKSTEEQHIVAQWYQDWCKYRKEAIERTRGSGSAIPTGNVWSLLTLAYDIYCLQHTSNLNHQFIERLKNYTEFQGALYEVRTAAILARLNYKIIPINFKSTKHCEYFAERENKIAIEVKSRGRRGVLNKEGQYENIQNLKTGIHRLFNDALKHNVHNTPFIVFIDINMPVSQTRLIIPPQYKQWWKDMFIAVNSLPVGTQEKPDKFNALFVTNFSYHYQRNNLVDTGKFNAESGVVVPKYCSCYLNHRLIYEINDSVSKYGHVPRCL